jgi:hypothetical protein
LNNYNIDIKIIIKKKFKDSHAPLRMDAQIATFAVIIPKASNA